MAFWFKEVQGPDQKKLLKNGKKARKTSAVAMKLSIGKAISLSPNLEFGK